MTPADHQKQNPNDNRNDPEDGAPTDAPAEHRTPRSPRGWMRAIGRRKRQLAWEHYRSLDATARAGISDEDYATTMATLEAMARNLGWSEADDAERRDAHHGRGHGHGHGHGWKHRGPRGMRRGHHGRCSARATAEA